MSLLLDQVLTVPNPNIGESSGLVLQTSMAYGLFGESGARDFYDLDKSSLVNTKYLGPVKGVAVFVHPTGNQFFGYTISFDEKQSYSSIYMMMCEHLCD